MNYRWRSLLHSYLSQKKLLDCLLYSTLLILNAYIDSPRSFILHWPFDNNTLIAYDVLYSPTVLFELMLCWFSLINIWPNLSLSLSLPRRHYWFPMCLALSAHNTFLVMYSDSIIPLYPIITILKCNGFLIITIVMMHIVQIVLIWPSTNRSRHFNWNGHF